MDPDAYWGVTDGHFWSLVSELNEAFFTQTPEWEKLFQAEQEKQQIQDASPGAE